MYRGVIGLGATHLARLHLLHTRAPPGACLTVLDGLSSGRVAPRGLDRFTTAGRTIATATSPVAWRLSATSDRPY